LYPSGTDESARLIASTSAEALLIQAQCILYLWASEVCESTLCDSLKWSQVSIGQYCMSVRCQAIVELVLGCEWHLWLFAEALYGPFFAQTQQRFLQTLTKAHSPRMCLGIP